MSSSLTPSPQVKSVVTTAPSALSSKKNWIKMRARSFSRTYPLLKWTRATYSPLSSAWSPWTTSTSSSSSKTPRRSNGCLRWMKCAYSANSNITMSAHPCSRIPTSSIRVRVLQRSWLRIRRRTDIRRGQLMRVLLKCCVSSWGKKIRHR
jgi:hypothetical protein